MVDSLKNIGIVVLAAGRGKRMKASPDEPKVLTPLLGRPLLSHLLTNIKSSVVQTTPVVVIAPDLYIIRERIGPICEYAIQESQLGTGHAVLSAKQKLLKYDHILVLYGDHPLVSTRTIDTLTVQHLTQGSDVTLATLRLPHFDDWFSFFEGYGRIERDKTGALAGIVEKKDARPEQCAITEVNPGYYLFNSRWLWSALPKLSRDNAPREYYLTDVLTIAISEHRKITDVPLTEPEEGLGINTPEQLATVEKIMQGKLDEVARLRVGQLPL